MQAVAQGLAGCDLAVGVGLHKGWGAEWLVARLDGAGKAKLISRSWLKWIYVFALVRISSDLQNSIWQLLARPMLIVLHRNSCLSE